MGVIGTSSGGYATLNPTQSNPIGEAVQNVENSAFRYRAEKREEDQLKAKQAKELKDARDAQTKENINDGIKYGIVPTGVESYDQTSFNYLTDLKTKIADSRRVLNSSNNPEERRKAENVIISLNTAYEVYKKAPEDMNAILLDLTKGVKDGTYNPDSSSESAKTIQAINKGTFKPVIQKDGTTKWITYLRNPDNSLSSIVDKELTTSEMMEKLKPIKNYNDVMLSKDFESILPKHMTKTEVGDKIIEGYNGLEGLIAKTADDVVSNRDKMYGITKKLGITPQYDVSKYNDDEKDAVRKYITESLTDKYKPSETTNYAKLSSMQQAENQKRMQANADREFNYKANKDKEDGKEKPLGAENINKIGNVTGNQKIKDTAIEKADGAKVYSIQGTNLERSFGKDGAYERVKNVYVLKDGKTIVFDVDRVDGTVKYDEKINGKTVTNTTAKTTQIAYRSDKDGNQMADFVTKYKNPKTGKKYKDVPEFMRDALGIKPTTPAKAATKTTTAPKEDLRKKYNY